MSGAPDSGDGPDVLVLGLGSPECGADAAGRLAAAALANRAPAATTVRELRGDALELMQCWEGARAVILIDAVVTGAAAGRVLRFDASAQPLPAARGGTSSHDLGLAEALELARALGSLPPRVVVIGIEGDDFTPGAPLSTAVREGVERAAALAAEEARAIAGKREASHA